MVAEGIRRRTVASRPEQRRIAIAALLAVALVLLRLHPALAANRYFDFKHVEANAGGSSGGHAALCLDENCYHFQQDEYGTLRLEKESRARFELAYRVLGNRTVHTRRVEVQNATYTRLADAFEQYHRIQSQQFAVRESLNADQHFLEYLRGLEDGGLESGRAPQLPGTGYFFADEEPEKRQAPADLPSSQIAALAQRVGATYGTDFLERRAAELQVAISALRPEPSETLALPEAGAMPPAFAGFADRYRELLTGWLAITVLREARGLRPGSWVAWPDPVFALSEAETVALRRYAVTLGEDLVRLVGSKRPDWGFPLLVGMARLLAVDASVSAGTLVLLDVFAADAATLPTADLAKYSDALTMLLAERRQDFLRMQQAFFDDEELSEARWSRLETAGNLFAELARATRERTPLRVHADRLVPSKAVRGPGWPHPVLTRATLENAILLSRGRERTYSHALSDLYRYDLLRRNCATELLHTLASAVTDDGLGATSAASATPLSRRKDPDGWLTFIPFVAARSVGHTYHVVASTDEPSYRQLKMDESYAHENALIVYLREVNVLTSRIYHRNAADPVFLLFTDDTILARPLYGVLNLATAMVASAAGLVLLPADSGALLRAGLSGALFSLPELGFVNIRKGSFPIAPRRWLNEGQGEISDSSGPHAAL